MYCMEDCIELNICVLPAELAWRVKAREAALKQVRAQVAAMKQSNSIAI